jgi:hypothetical protein
MDRILLVVAIAFLYSSTSLAADEDRVYEGLQYTLATYHEDGYDAAKPAAWTGKYSLFTNENVPMDRGQSDTGTGIGFGVAPLFGTYGVYRTSNRNRSTYLALGFTVDAMTTDEAGTSDIRGDNGLSYGIGISKPSFNIEYMMSMDEGNYKISAIGLGFISEF